MFSLCLRHHRWPTGISLQWPRWPSRWWRRAGTLPALRKSDSKDSSTATPSQRTWYSETVTPTDPSGSEPGTTTLLAWVALMFTEGYDENAAITTKIIGTNFICAFFRRWVLRKAFHRPTVLLTFFKESRISWTGAYSSGVCTKLTNK